MAGKRAKQAANSAAGHVHGPGCNHDHTHDGHAHGEPVLKIKHRSDDAEQRSKDELFVRLALVAQTMIDTHGKDFAMGALVLSARFIAEGKPLVKSENSTTGANTATATTS